MLPQVSKPVLDHVAIGTAQLADGWELFAGLLGGTWVYGGDSPGYWWGQLEFSAGPKVELLTPAGGPDAAFLERFLAARGAGPHHFNFTVPDIGETLSLVRAAGIEPVQVNFDNPDFKEAFLHPRDAYGIVIQVAQQDGPPPPAAVPDLPAAGPPHTFTLIEYEVSDLAGATALFRDVLRGELVTATAEAAELTWTNGARLRLRQGAPAAGRPTSGTAGPLNFRPDREPLGPADRLRAEDLAARLGVTLRLPG
jgi:methylmalonyl-CoA/ethylmalonyl-CoA epimerase